MQDILSIQWLLVILASVALFFIAPLARTAGEFFQAEQKDRQPGFWLLTSSLIISWIFAKSITNAANLGLSFGMVGGLAYAAYYASFLVAGWVIYRMRTKGGFQSIHEFLGKRFGRGAIAVFSILISIRLFNEVWSNTMVIGSYFGEVGSTSFLLAAVVFTVLTLAYVLKGGLRSSMLTDAIQMALFGVLLFVILGVLLPARPEGVGEYISSGSWTWAGGLNLLLVALLQSLSYPFHDPVLTDRGFIAPPKLTLRAYFLAAIIGAICIVLFSFVGIYAQFSGMEGQAPVVVAQSLGIGLMLVMNLIMVTSAASTLDSTFASFAKLAIFDLKWAPPKISYGRWAMIIIAIIGTIPVFLGPEILSATTVSGTMVMGLAPVFIFWNRKAPAISFQLPVWFGIILGVVLAAGWWPTAWVWFPGKYGDLLSINLLGLPLCFILWWLPLALLNFRRKANQI